MPNKKQTKPSQLDCPICGGKHHATACNMKLDKVAANALKSMTHKCTRCPNPTFGGPYCVACTIDRALERILNANKN